MLEEQQSSEQRRSNTILHITARTGQEVTFHRDLQELLIFYAHYPHLAHQLEGMRIAIERKDDQE